jgi:hypothetical protein
MRVHYSINRVISVSSRLYDNHKVFFSRYIGYFYHIERTSQASVILSYSFPIHDLIAGWGVAV